MVVITTLAAGLIEFDLSRCRVYSAGNLRGSSGRLEVCELVFGLLSEVAPIYQEEDAFCSTEFEQPVGDIDSSKGLARACGHLDERARVGPT